MEKLKKIILGTLIATAMCFNVYKICATKMYETNLNLFNIEMSANGANCEVTRDVYHKYGCFGNTSNKCVFMIGGRTFSCDGEYHRIW